MKKILLMLTGVIALGFGVDASALPLFARQTGMACSACHFQHFPMLTGFGRAFKSAGYTMIATEGKVEGEGLSIPNALNMAVLATAGYEKSNQAGSSTPVNTTGDGAFYVPGNGGELSLFMGGRVSSNAGFLAEVGTGGSISGTSVSGARGSAKLPVLFELDPSMFKFAEGTRMGFIPFATDDEGVSYGFELLNTGANTVHQMNVTTGLNGAHGSAFSAQQYIGTDGAATGVALVANNPIGFINLTKYDRIGISHSALATLGSTYFRVAGTFDLMGWDTGLGFQNWSAGSPSEIGTAGSYGVVQTKASAIDGQMQGKLWSLPAGLYASYARAPAGNANSYNTDPAAAVSGSAVTTVQGTATKSAFNIAFEVGVIPDRATVGASFRAGRSGVAVGGVSNASDNAIMFLATYKLAQNMIASLTVTSASGDYWDSAHKDALGSSTMTIDLSTLF
jgi:hypothetical protein